MNCDVAPYDYSQLVCQFLCVNMNPFITSWVKRGWPWHHSRGRKIHSAKVFQHFVIIVIINRTVHVNIFRSKGKAVSMHSVKSSDSQIIIDCCLEHVYSSFVCQLYLLDLKCINLYSWFSDLVCRIVCLSWQFLERQNCLYWLFSLFSNLLPSSQRNLFLTYFIVFKYLYHWILASVFIPGSYHGAILIVLLCISLLLEMPDWSWPQQL